MGAPSGVTHRAPRPRHPSRLARGPPRGPRRIGLARLVELLGAAIGVSPTLGRLLAEPGTSSGPFQIRAIARRAWADGGGDEGGRPGLRRGAAILQRDVYASASKSGVLAEAVDRLGYRAVGAPGAHALRLRATADSLPLEIHPRSRQARGAARAAASRPGAPAAAPADTGPTTLVRPPHATEQHAEGRGSLRDLLVLADALDPLRGGRARGSGAVGGGA